MKYEIKYNDLFEFTEADNILTISGRAWKGLTVPNKKVLLTSEKEIENIAKTLKGAPLQADHSKNIRDTIGKVFESTQDGDSVLYRAKVHDQEIAQKIKDRLINQCSVSLSSEDIKENFTYNGEEGWTALTGVSVVEMSLVLKGAVVGNSVMPEFSFSIIEDDPVESEPVVEFDKTLGELAIVRFEELLKKYNYLMGMFEGTNNQLNITKKELSNLNKRYEYLLSTGEEMDEKYVNFDEETVLLIAELRNEMKNNRAISGKVADEDVDSTTTRDMAKSELKKMIFDTNPKTKKEITSWKEFKKKFDLSDNK